MGYFKTMKGLEFEFRVANIEDLYIILALNQKWTVTSLDNVDRENGFLFCTNYNPDDLTKIIEANEVALATYQNQLIGYYINDSYSYLTEKYSNAINMLKENGTISPEKRVSMRTQIVVDKEYQRMGVPTEMLSVLKPILRKKYDFLFSIGRNDNPKRIAHEKAGWKIVWEDMNNYYCTYDLGINLDNE